MDFTVLLHHVAVHFTSPDDDILRRVARIYQPFATVQQPADLEVSVQRMVEPLPVPRGDPVIAEEGRLAYFLDGDQLIAHFMRWGQLHVDLAAGRFAAHLAPLGLDTYSVLEDMLIIGLAPLLRRRGLFTLHALAAARHNQAVLLVGGMGAGKTTTGISLLRAGWSLLSNDSPLLYLDGDLLTVVAYPGLLSAHDDSLGWFPELAGILDGPARTHEHTRLKRLFAAETIYPNVWGRSAQPAAICFPEVVPGIQTSYLEPVSSRQALVTILPQSIENWDRPLVGQHLDILGRLVEVAPSYRLCLAPDVGALPVLLGDLLDVPGRPRHDP